MGKFSKYIYTLRICGVCALQSSTGAAKSDPFLWKEREPEEMQRGGEQERGMSPGFDGIVQLDIIH